MLHTINLFSFTKLNNQEFAGLMINSQRLISTATASALGIEPAVNTAFNDRLRELNDQVYAPAASAVTATMQAADAKRSTIFRRIRLKLQTVEYAEVGSSLLKVADKVRTELLSKYTGRIATMPYQEKTAVLQGLLFDLHDKLDDDDVELLGLEGDITRLEQANNAFVEAYQDRVNERAEAETEKTVRLRQELTELFATICYTLQFMANSTAEANSQKAEACQQLMRQLNVVLAETRARYLQRRKLQNGTDDGGSDTGEGDNTHDDGGSGSTGGGSGSTGGGDGGSTGGSDTGSGGTNGTGGGSTGSNPNVTEF